MSDDFIDYGKLIDDAMHVIVKQALKRVSTEGLPGRHHFFISFITTYPGVELSKALRSKYPDEMTIVLQHQFEDLTIDETCFSVVLSFEGVKERIKIPFDALVAFADPSVKFGLQFRHIEDYDEFEDEFADIADVEDLTNSNDKKSPTALKEDAKAPKGKSKKSKKALKAEDAANNVVDIDAFRKK